MTQALENIKSPRWGHSPANADPSVDGCNQVTRALAEADLARSGLTIEDAAQAGIFPVDDASSFHLDFAAHPALIIPYRRPDGSITTYEKDGIAVPYMRARYLSGPFKRLPKDGRKYDGPEGSGVQIFYPGNFDWAEFLSREQAAACIVEGCKKAAALCRAGIPCIGIDGVDNVCLSGTKALHPDLARIAGRCSAVYVIFDSDILTNKNVQRAEMKLATHLSLLGKRVHAVRLPASDKRDANGDPIKVGADDYLVTLGGVDDGAEPMLDFIEATPALGERSATLGDEGAISVSDMLAREVLPVEELIPGLLEKGIATFLCGPGGVHKSRLAHQLGLALNAGAGPFGPVVAKVDAILGKPVMQATLVYFSAEDDENELARRAQAISRELELPVPGCGIFMPRKGKDSALAIMRENAECTLTPYYFEVRERLRSIEGHKIVVMDSAYDHVRFGGHGKIDEDSVNFFIKVVLQGLCDQTDSTLLIPWHPSQAGSGREDMGGWSVAWHNAPRARLALDKTDKEDEFELKVVKRNHAAKGPPIILRFHNGALLPPETLPEAAEDAGKLRRIVVREATRAAEIGLPFQQQRNIPPGVLRQAEQECARKLTNKTFKEELRSAAMAGDLQYLPGDKRHAAGFYPSTGQSDPKELARRAKTNGKGARA